MAGPDAIPEATLTLEPLRFDLVPGKTMAIRAHPAAKPGARRKRASALALFRHSWPHCANRVALYGSAVDPQPRSGRHKPRTGDAGRYHVRSLTMRGSMHTSTRTTAPATMSETSDEPTIQASPRAANLRQASLARGLKAAPVGSRFFCGQLGMITVGDETGSTATFPGFD